MSVQNFKPSGWTQQTASCNPITVFPLWYSAAELRWLFSAADCSMESQNYTVNAGLSMAFKHCFHLLPIWLQYLFAIDSESRQRSFPSLSIRIGCAVLLESKQTPFSRTQSWFRSAALHRTPFWTFRFVPLPYFHSETNELLKYWAKQWVVLWSVGSSVKYIYFPFWIKKATVIMAQNPQSIDFLALKLNQYHESGSTFSSSEPVTAHSYCWRLGNTCVCSCCPTSCSTQHCLNCLAIDFASKPSIFFCNNLFE